jgi:hypothetical protein
VFCSFQSILRCQKVTCSHYIATAVSSTHQHVTSGDRPPRFSQAVERWTKFPDWERLNISLFNRVSRRVSLILIYNPSRHLHRSFASPVWLAIPFVVNYIIFLISIMYASIILLLPLVILNLPLSLAFDEINTDSKITAGTNTTIRIVNDLSQGPRSFDAQFDSYRIYLSLGPPGWGSAPACYLVNSSAINVTSQTVQIPASVGPSDRSSQSYAIAAIEFNQDPNAGPPSGFEFSNLFDFVGGTGNWSQYELDGYVPGDPDFTPCSAYDCARQCSQKYYPSNVDSDSASAYKPTYDCLVACPGTSYPPFDSLFGGSGGPSGGGSSGSPGGSTLGNAGTTSLRAAGGFTQLNSSPTSTGSMASPATSSASNGQASPTSPSSGASTVSSTSSASTPSASKSAASLVLSSQLATLAAVIPLLLSIFRY